MKKALFTISVIIMLAILPRISFATHIVGGELNYTCLGNDMYELTLTIFRDCENGIPDFDYPASIGIFSYDAATDTYSLETSITDTTLLSNEFLTKMAAPGNNFTLSQIGSSFQTNIGGNNYLISQGHLLIPYINNDTLNPTLSNPCLVVPPNVCVNTTTYRDTVHLPFIPGGYTLAYQRCCRNYIIQNIVEPDGSGATYQINLSETALLECNTNAQFIDWPPIYICANEPIDFDHSAFDPDGDSLVYKLCTPFTGGTRDTTNGDPGPRPNPPLVPPYDTVVWLAPTYSLENILGGVPLAIDSETGFLTGTPNTIGNFVVGICVEEYRNGELISTTRRDFQYNVGICGTITSSFFVPEVSCDGLEVFFDNQSANADEFFWEFNDPGNPMDTSSIMSPTFTYQDTGTYIVSLTANPSSPTCSVTSTDTFSVYNPSLFPGFDFELTSCENPVMIELTDFSTDSVFNIVGWEWYVDDVLFSTDATPTTYLGNTIQEEIEIKLVLTNEGGCMDSTIQLVNLGLNLGYEKEILNCDPLDSLMLEVVDLGNPDVLNFSWAPSNAILSGGSTMTPWVDLNVATTFYFTVTYDNDCVFEDSILVINGNVDLMLTASATPDSIYKGNSSQLLVTGANLVEYIWESGETLDDPTIENPLATPLETTTYYVTATDVNGCIDSISILVVILDLRCVDPFIFMPNAFSPNGDNENDVLKIEGNIIEELYLVIYNRWGEKVFETRDQTIGWDGTFGNELLEPDVYGYYLTVKCENGEEYFKKGNVSLLR